jgi:fucose 4-O-acetylase-like acetyltransferase
MTISQTADKTQIPVERTRRAAVEHDRLQWVDQAKGIGIVLVVYGHVISGVQAAGIHMDEQAYRLTWDSIYAFHIPLFFFLSGLFFPQSWQRRGTWGVLANKVDTLVYPYVLWSLLQGFLQVALSQHVNHPVTAGEVLSLLWQPRQEFWFLYALFFVYLIACLLYALLPARHRWVLLVAAALLYFLRTSVPHIAAISYPAWNLVYFLAGALLPQAANAVVKRPAAWLGIAAAIFVLAELTRLRWGGGQADPVVSAANLVAASAGITATLAVSVFFARMNWNAGAHLGRMSLQIYLVHTTAAGFTRIMLRALGVHDVYAHVILGTAVGVGAPLLLAYLFERYGISGVFSAPRPLQLQYRRSAA